jgi:hypothetical protein
LGDEFHSFRVWVIIVVVEVEYVEASLIW